MADAAGRAQEAWLSAMAASGPVATRVVNTTLSGCLDANAGLWMYTGLELAARGRAALLVQVRPAPRPLPRATPPPQPSPPPPRVHAQVCTVLLFEYLAAARHLPLPAFGRVALAEGEREALRGHAAQGENSTASEGGVLHSSHAPYPSPPSCRRGARAADGRRVPQPRRGPHRSVRRGSLVGRHAGEAHWAPPEGVKSAHAHPVRVPHWQSAEKTSTTQTMAVNVRLQGAQAAPRRRFFWSTG